VTEAGPTTEAELAALGVHRIPVPVPFAAAGGPVNVYLVEEADGGLLLVDSGLGTPAAEATLAAGFAALGRSFGEVRRLVLTHGHVDHYGGARALEVDLVLPGHGPPFSGHRAVVDGLLGFHEKRQRRLVEALADGPRTAFELARSLFPVNRPGELFLVISETVANLEVLELAGRAARAEQDGVYRYRPV
jgi:glyoxylase-like metal-dependent hydrolase (beta-lactamase superfamily II)